MRASSNDVYKMDYKLYEVGRTTIEPQTVFYWNFDKNALVEITCIEDQYIIKASKAYYLLNQDEKGRETWNRKIGSLNDYLAETFPEYRLSIDYVNEVDPDILNVKDEASDFAAEADQLLEEKNQVTTDKQSLENSLNMSLPEFEPVISDKLKRKADRQKQLESELDDILFELQERNHVLDQWKDDGVMSAILFQFSSDMELVDGSELEDAVARHLEQVFRHHQTRVKQTLTGSKFRLVVEDVTHPRVLTRSEHSSLLNPKTLNQIIDKHPHLEQKLHLLKQKYAAQFEPQALEDIKTQTRTYQRSKSTPSQATAAILRQLETQKITSTTTNAPNNGPYIGNILGSKQIVGFDPAEIGHFYLVGSTGSGKSHLKRVLIEAVAAENYDILSINPSDTQNIGLSLPNENHEKGIGLTFNQYWKGDDRLLDVPEDIEELFQGRNAVTLQGLSNSEKKEFVYKVFKKANEVDRKHKTLFIFLDEAHRFNDGDTAEAIQDAVREARKFGVNIVLASQSPKDFTYNYKKIRENTVNIFMRGEYFDYAENFIDDENMISKLQLGQAIFPASLEWDQFSIESRDTLTRFWEATPSSEEIEEVDNLFVAEEPSFDEPSKKSRVDSDDSQTVLTEDEQSVIDYIKQYIEQNDQAPSYSKCWRQDNTPFGSTKTRRILDQLVDKNQLAEKEETRYGNQTTVYSLK